MGWGTQIAIKMPRTFGGALDRARRLRRIQRVARFFRRFIGA
jgi:hypothetical protein